jgi:hypothetical protein
MHSFLTPTDRLGIRTSVATTGQLSPAVPAPDEGGMTPSGEMRSVQFNPNGFIAMRSSGKPQIAT